MKDKNNSLGIKMSNHMAQTGYISFIQVSDKLM
jgi:hypothetical protein